MNDYITPYEASDESDCPHSLHTDEATQWFSAFEAIQLYRQTGAGLVRQERLMQQKKWGDSHDDQHEFGQLADAGIAYAIEAVSEGERQDSPHSCFPWDADEWRPAGSQVGNLVKAASLITAEIDKHMRAFRRACNEITIRDLGFECFDELDAYELETADWVGADPESFIHEHFAEDYARLEGEEEERRLSDEAERWEDKYPESDTDDLTDEEKLRWEAKYLEGDDDSA